MVDQGKQTLDPPRSRRGASLRMLDEDAITVCICTVPIRLSWTRTFSFCLDGPGNPSSRDSSPLSRLASKRCGAQCVLPVVRGSPWPLVWPAGWGCDPGTCRCRYPTIAAATRGAGDRPLPNLYSNGASEKQSASLFYSLTRAWGGNSRTQRPSRLQRPLGQVLMFLT